jgi:hypothetical protein
VEEVDHLGELVDGLVAADHVAEAGGGDVGHLVLGVGEGLGRAGAAHAAHPAHGALLRHEDEEADDEGDGQERHQERAGHGWLGNGLGGEGDLGLLEAGHQLGPELVGIRGGHYLVALELEDHEPLVVVEDGLLDGLALERARLDGLENDREVTLADLDRCGGGADHHHHHHREEHHPSQDQLFPPVLEERRGGRSGRVLVVVGLRHDPLVGTPEGWLEPGLRKRLETDLPRVAPSPVPPGGLWVGGRGIPAARGFSRASGEEFGGRHGDGG